MRRTPLLVALAVLLAAAGSSNAARAREALPGVASATAPAPAGDVPAARTARLQGTASFDRNRPVVGATVLVRSEPEGPALWVTSTDDKGDYRFDDLPEGTYGIEFRREGFATVRKGGIELKYPFRAIVEVTLAPEREAPAADASPATARGAAGERGVKPVSLAGVALGRDGKPASDVRIQLFPAGGGEDPRRILSGPEGAFEIEGIAPGAWKLEASGMAFLPVRVALELRESKHLTLLLVPQPASYTPDPLDLMPDEQPIPPPGWNVDPPASAAPGGLGSDGKEG